MEIETSFKQFGKMQGTGCELSEIPFEPKKTKSIILPGVTGHRDIKFRREVLKNQRKVQIVTEGKIKRGTQVVPFPVRKIHSCKSGADQRSKRIRYAGEHRPVCESESFYIPVARIELLEIIEIQFPGKCRIEGFHLDPERIGKCIVNPG